MKVETKLETNQYVFLLFQDKVHEVKIESIQIKVDIHDNVHIKYWIDSNPCGTQYTKIFLEKELHETKEDLLKSL